MQATEHIHVQHLPFVTLEKRITDKIDCVSKSIVPYDCYTTSITLLN